MLQAKLTALESALHLAWMRGWHVVDIWTNLSHMIRALHEPSKAPVQV